MVDPTDVCPVCGLEYRKLRTGLDFESVQQMMWVANDDPETWRYKRRHTVLGVWREIKIGMWARHLRECSEQAEADVRAIDEEIPF